MQKSQDDTASKEQKAAAVLPGSVSAVTDKKQASSTKEVAKEDKQIALKQESTNAQAPEPIETSQPNSSMPPKMTIAVDESTTANQAKSTEQTTTSNQEVNKILEQHQGKTISEIANQS